MPLGCDINASTIHLIDTLKSSGMTFVGRYLGPIKEAQGNGLTHAEALRLKAAGLYLVSIWENGFPTSKKYFTKAQGTKDGQLLHEYAEKVGQPKGTPVYVTVDYDAVPSDLDAYWKALASTLQVYAPGYDLACYGSGAVLHHLKAKGWISHGWLAQATGWDGSRDYDAWDIKQGRTISLGGYSVDLDTSNGHAGGWQPE